jgi:hypothetical protein
VPVAYVEVGLVQAVMAAAADSGYPDDDVRSCVGRSAVGRRYC